MTGNLDQALEALAREALPGLLGGDTPPVQMIISSLSLEVDPESADATASSPRPDDRTDNFPLDPNNPAGPYTLTQPPYPGPRRVRLTTDTGDRVALRQEEVTWDVTDVRLFTLNLGPARDLTTVTGVQVLYSRTAVFTRIKARQSLSLALQSDDASSLDQAEALVTAVVGLNRQRLMDNSTATFEDADYGAHIEIKGLALERGSSPSPDRRLLTFQAEIEIKATRALREDEGRPIERILTPGRPVDPDRSIDVHIEVDT
jgi:hypothetical protein